MSEQQHDDPAGHAATRITSYVSVAALAAEAIAQVAAGRATERAERDARAVGALRAARHAAYGQARLGWAPMLDPRLRDRTGVVDVGLVWARAQPWRPDAEAEVATSLAEDRLRELRRDVMDRYDRLRSQGVEPVEAMRRVAPWFDSPPTRTGERGPDRAVLAQADTARRVGDAELTLYLAGSAVPDDPRTLRVDEHADAAAQATPHRTAAAQQDGLGRALQATADRTPDDRTPAEVSGEGYPTSITASSAGTARAAAGGRVAPTGRPPQRAAARASR